MTEQVKLSVFYSYQPEKVWQALTDCRILNAWMMKNDFEPRIGHKFKFEGNSLLGTKTIIHCEVVELQKPKRLAYTWQDEISSERSLVIWTLTPVESGTQLQLRHQRIEYATKVVCDQSRNFENNSDLLSLFLDQRSPINFNQQMPPTNSLQLRTRDELISLLNYRDFEEEWNYRLNHKFPQVLRRYC